MLVLIDGVDLTGKSTLARKLAALVSPPAFVQHNAGPPTTLHPVSEYLQPIEQLVERSRWDRAPSLVSAVVDRSYVSEMVWPKVFERPTLMDMDMFDAITDRLGSLGAVHVHAFRDPEKLRRELIEAQEPVYHLDKAARLYELAYERVASRGGLVLPWDYETMEEGQDLDWMVEAATDYRQERAA